MFGIFTLFEVLELYTVLPEETKNAIGAKIKYILRKRYENMASAKEKVLSGDYQGMNCSICGGKHLSIWSGDNKTNIQLTKEEAKRYEVLDAEERKSATSGILRAGIGTVALGPIGLAAGLSAKRKDIYTVSIEFWDGKRSLVEINEKSYKRLIQDMF